APHGDQPSLARPGHGVVLATVGSLRRGRPRPAGSRRLPRPRPRPGPGRGGRRVGGRVAGQGPVVPGRPRRPVLRRNAPRPRPRTRRTVEPPLRPRPARGPSRPL